MDHKEAKAKYNAQKRLAKWRGIDFRLTFDEWLAFWGPDIDRRGCRVDELSMQRPADRGAYELGNIRKGTPAENAVTRGVMRQAKAWQVAAAEYAASREPSPDDGTDDDRPEWNESGYATQWGWLERERVGIDGRG